MATLENIRKRSGLLIVIIGVALGAFLLGDLMMGGTSIFTSNTNVVGTIDGVDVSYTEFNNRMQELRMQDQAYADMPENQLANIVWQGFISEIIFEEVYSDLGFTITEDELLEEIIRNPNIQQQQSFIDENGRFSRSRFINLLRNLRDNRNANEQAQQQWAAWTAFEEDVAEQALQFKFDKAIQSSVYTPVALARHQFANNNVTRDVAILQLPYTSVADDQVEVTEADFKAYYEEYKHKYKQDFETRDIVYVNFELAPSELDKQEVREELEGLIGNSTRFNRATNQTDTIIGFAETEDDSAFVVANSTLPYRPGYWRTGDLSSNVDSIMFQAEPGYIHGPYEESGGYKLTKLQEIKMLPDSVSARHILITFNNGQQGNQSQRTIADARALADSLLEVINNGTTPFDSLVTEFSEDPGSIADGGLYEMFPPKQMVGPFENFAFQNEPGTTGIVQTQFGFHIMEVMEHSASKSKAVKVATIYQEVIISSRTENEIYSKAQDFANAAANGNFVTVAQEMGLQARPMTELQATADGVIGLAQARDVVTWAFGKEKEVSVGDVQLINNQGKSFVVVQLTDITEEGYKTLEDVRENITPMVTNRVKAEKVLMPRAQELMNGETAMQAVTEKSDENMAIQQVRLGNSSITGVGNEPVVVGEMSATPVGPLAGPIVGNRGVYIWQVNAESPFNDKSDYSTDVDNITGQAKSTFAAQILLNAISNEKEIVDNRMRFF